MIVSGDSNQVAITLEQYILGSIGLSKVEDILAPTYLFCVHPNVNKMFSIKIEMHSDQHNINFLLHRPFHLNTVVNPGKKLLSMTLNLENSL